MAKADSIVIDVPNKLPAGTGHDPVENAHAGRVLVPGRWTGADWQAYHEASLPVSDDRPDHQWLRQWRWAKERVLEWELEGISTNPAQIDDDVVPWPLMSYLTKAVHGAMLDYYETSDAIIDTLSYPGIADLQASEMFAFERAVRDFDDDISIAPLLKSWRTGRVIIRQWANGATPAADGLNVDLALIGAVAKITNETMTGAFDLGNSRGPRGRP